MNHDPKKLMENARRELLDLSSRNRLLAVPVHSQSARILCLQEPRFEEVFQTLVVDRKTLNFQSGSPEPEPEPEPEPQDAPTPSDPSVPSVPLPFSEPETPPRRPSSPSRLQTTLTPQALRRRLLDLMRDAQTNIEETGVNILYLAFGLLRWIDDKDTSTTTTRHAPLLLVPVQLERRNAATRFILRARDEDIQENLSLRTKLLTDFGLDFPEFPSAETLSPSTYFQAVAAAIKSRPGWEVLPDTLTLGFFSFTKLLMYRDLDATTWPGNQPLFSHPLISGVLGEGFAPVPDPFPDDISLDTAIPVEKLDYVVDADSSQSIAIERVRHGQSIVIQGPPGTGKSQSIANIIATAVLDGKTVLFVAEKLAALEVVFRRLDREGLGELCLPLHSNTVSKRAVLAEIGKTWRLGKPKARKPERVMDRLRERRDALNAHCHRLHTPHSPSGLTPYDVVGELVHLEGHTSESPLTPVRPDLPNAHKWSPDERQERDSLLRELAEMVCEIGPPADHPWRGVRRPSILPMDLPPLLARTRQIAEQIQNLGPLSDKLASILRLNAPTHLADLNHQILMARQIANAPQVDREALCHSVWKAGWEGLARLVESGHRLHKLESELQTRFTESTWEKDFDSVRTAFAASGQSLFRIFNSAYRNAIATLRGSLKIPLPSSFKERIEWIDQIIQGQRLRKQIVAEDSIGTNAFGSVWQGHRSDWNLLSRILDWIDGQRKAGLDAGFLQHFTTITPDPELRTLANQLDEHSKTLTTEIKGIIEALDLDIHAAFHAADANTVRFPDWIARLSLWQQQQESLSRWTLFNSQNEATKSLGLGPILEHLHDGTLDPDNASNAFRAACHRAVLRDMMQNDPVLAHFDGLSHERTLREFRKVDEERLTLAKYILLTEHHQGLPHPSGAVGAVGILNSELERKRGHRPVRQLLRDAGSVVQAIKPVFMMSPLSIAQFIEPGTLTFDVLVIDEASQIQPVDALGAIARCRQLVVVGDSQQLPPTRFFARLTENLPDQDADDGQAQLQDMESILGLCCARGLPQTMLRWHYRSRHHSLIAVSNREFYDNKLFIIPSPHAHAENLGLQFRHVPDGIFDSGGRGDNKIEANQVIDAVIRHAREHPSISLGVVAFSVRQQETLLDILDERRRQFPEIEAFFSSSPDEPFFIKNLENVQGDERDVIFISIGYGRDSKGTLAMRFGPLSNEGGERRLNVLISRARRQCVVFSSITANEIDLNRAQGRGVQALKTYLETARAGHLPLERQSLEPVHSPLEETVQTVLEQEGYEVHRRLGIAGLFIDLAVVDPDEHGRYLLGIEFDGPNYNAARSSRDRDRLRQSVLESQGWILHRIWSLDWFQRPAEQQNRLIDAIDAAHRRRKRPSPSNTSTQATAPSSAPAIDRESLPRTPRTPQSPHVTTPYEIAQIKPPRGSDPLKMDPAKLADVIRRIVEVEGPIHRDEILLRIRDVWGLPRIYSKFQETILAAIQILIVSGKCIQIEDCLDFPDRPVIVRNRESAISPSLRKPDNLPWTEIEAGILALIDIGHGVAIEELPGAMASAFGLKTTSASLRHRVSQVRERLEEKGEIHLVRGLLQRTGPIELDASIETGTSATPPNAPTDASTTNQPS